MWASLCFFSLLLSLSPDKTPAFQSQPVTNRRPWPRPSDPEPVDASRSVEAGRRPDERELRLARWAVAKALGRASRGRAQTAVCVSGLFAWADPTRRSSDDAECGSLRRFLEMRHETNNARPPGPPCRSCRCRDAIVYCHCRRRRGQVVWGGVWWVVGG